MTKHLLIVDDDQYIRDLYVELMKDAGYLVQSAEDGLEGLDKLKKQKFDLVLLDINMPKLDGIQVLKKFAEDSGKGKGSKIIILTNLGHDPIIKEALDMGASAWLIKADMNPDELLHKVKEFLK